MHANIRPFGTTRSGQEVSLIALRHGALRASLLTYGAALQDLRIDGVGHSLTLGGADFSAYDGGPMRHFGTLVGPVANRIGGARALIGGRYHDFPPNEGRNLLHGGEDGCHAQNWRILDCADDAALLGLHLPDGLGGFPGNRELTAEFRLTDMELTLRLGATTDAPTLINLANHSYWNLDGDADTNGHKLRVLADSYLPTVDNLPSGAPAPVAGDFDFRKARGLGAPLDHNFCLATAPRGLSPAAELSGASGLCLRLETTAPGLQVYDGAGIDSGGYAGHEGRAYGAHAGIALEAQHWPDATNNPGYPGIGLAPGERYEQITRFSFARPSR